MPYKKVFKGSLFLSGCAIYHKNFWHSKKEGSNNNIGLHRFFANWSGYGITSVEKAAFHIPTTDLQICFVLKCVHWKLSYNNYKTTFYSSH